MKVLLIGNFAPPFDEESLHNICLLRRLQGEGHACTTINISENRAADASFVNAASTGRYCVHLLRHSINKDVIHFMTRGYLRVGLLKLMLAVFAGTVMRAKRILTIHSEFFSVLGQMRSPFGGTQTLYTSFYLADRIFVFDRDTWNAANKYMKKDNFQLISPFISLPEDIDTFQTSHTERMKEMNCLIFFANVKHPSFLFDTLTSMVTGTDLPPGTGFIIALRDKPSLQLQHGLQDSSGEHRDRIFFIEHDDLQSSLKTLSYTPLILRPMSCDGTAFFEDFALCARQSTRSGGWVSFPWGMVLVKEGTAADIAARIVTTLLSSEKHPHAAESLAESYNKITEAYGATIVP